MTYLADTNVMWRRFDPADTKQPEIKAAFDKLLQKPRALRGG